MTANITMKASPTINPILVSRVMPTSLQAAQTGRPVSLKRRPLSYPPRGAFVRSATRNLALREHGLARRSASVGVIGFLVMTR